MATCVIESNGMATCTVMMEKNKKNKKRKIFIKYRIKHETLVRDLLAHFTLHAKDKLKEIIVEKSFSHFTEKRRQELCMAIVNKPKGSKKSQKTGKGCVVS